VQNDCAWTTVLRPGEPAIRATRSCTAADYQTNARVLQYTTRGNTLVRLSIADGRHVLSLRDGLLSVAADDHLDDLSLSMTTDVLELFASHPLGRLNIQGSALAGVSAVRLNGRDLPVTVRGRRDSLEIPASAWADARTVNTREPKRERSALPEPGIRNLEHGTVVCVE